mgnify:FL=1
MEERFKSVTEFNVKTLEIAGFGAALQALRLPFGKECRSEIYFVNIDSTCGFDSKISTACGIKLDPKDLHLMSTLVKRGDEHAKVIRGINVYTEINAPRYFWQEMDTYCVGTERLSSESSMHIQGKGLATDELLKFKENLTEATMQRRVQMFSYQTLRRIYIQRRNHRLPQWHIFCDWIKTLPYADELITVGIDDSNNVDA